MWERKIKRILFGAYGQLGIEDLIPKQSIIAIRLKVFPEGLERNFLEYSPDAILGVYDGVGKISKKKNHYQFFFMDWFWRDSGFKGYSCRRRKTKLVGAFRFKKWGKRYCYFSLPPSTKKSYGKN